MGVGEWRGRGRYHLTCLYSSHPQARIVLPYYGDGCNTDGGVNAYRVE